MTFLDSSTIIEYLRDNETVIEYLDERQPWWTSTLCVFEVLNGPAGSPNFDPVAERQTFGGVHASNSTNNSRWKPLAFKMPQSRTAVSCPIETP